MYYESTCMLHINAFRFYCSSALPSPCFSHIVYKFLHWLADEIVSGGTVNAIVMVGTLPYQKSYGLCDLLKDVNITCPVKSGKLSFGIKLKVPEFTPAVSAWS